MLPFLTVNEFIYHMYRAGSSESEEVLLCGKTDVDFFMAASQN